MERKFKVTIGEKTFIVKVEEVRAEGEAVRVTSTAVTPSVKPPLEEKPPELAVRAVLRGAEPTAGEEGVVKAPMSGVILSIKCNVNDRVEKGDVILMLEAMKMENEIYAPKSGVVKRLAVSEQQSVNYGDILVVID